MDAEWIVAKVSRRRGSWWCHRVIVACGVALYVSSGCRTGARIPNVVSESPARLSDKIESGIPIATEPDRQAQDVPSTDRGQRTEPTPKADDAEDGPHVGGNIGRALHVERLRHLAESGRITGDFDAVRNKLTIDTRNLAGFSLDTALVPIDWDRRVILRLDGTNSELKHRQRHTLHFERSRYGHWVVQE